MKNIEETEDILVDIIENEEEETNKILYNPRMTFSFNSDYTYIYNKLKSEKSNKSEIVCKALAYYYGEGGNEVNQEFESIVISRLDCILDRLDKAGI